MKTLKVTVTQHGTLRINKSSLSHWMILNNGYLYHISHRHKVQNPRFSKSAQQVDKLDFHFKNYGQFDQSGHQDPNYENLDFTLPESQFLKDIDEQLIRNTYIEYNSHWMKNFIKFTDAEFESFNRKSSESSESSDSTIQEPIGYARIANDDVDDISESLQYLEEWKKNIKEKKLEDDYQVKLPNGLIIPYDEYLHKLSENESGHNKKKQIHTPKQLEAIKRHNEWHKTQEPVHDEYGLLLLLYFYLMQKFLKFHAMQF